MSVNTPFYNRMCVVLQILFFFFLSTLWFWLVAEQQLDLTLFFWLPGHCPGVIGCVLGMLSHGRGILAIRAGLAAHSGTRTVNSSLAVMPDLHPDCSQPAFHAGPVIPDRSPQHTAVPCRGEDMPGQQTWALGQASPLTRTAALSQSVHCEEPVFSRTEDPPPRPRGVRRADTWG